MLEAPQDGWWPSSYIMEGRSSSGRLDPVSLLPRLGELLRQGERGIGGMMRHLQEATANHFWIGVGFLNCSSG